MRLLVGLLAALVLLSGCVRSDDPNPYATPPEPGKAGLMVIVQDDARERVGNATVLVIPSGAHGLTDELGRFLARDLSPGNYSVTVNAPGHYEARKGPCEAVADEFRECIVLVDRRQR